MRRILGFCVLIALPFCSWAQTVGEPIEGKMGLYYQLPNDTVLNIRKVANKWQAYYLQQSEENAEEMLIVEPMHQKLILRGQGQRRPSDKFQVTLSRSGAILAHPRVFARPENYWLIVLVVEEGTDPQPLPRKLYR